jgi:hypothetical protein
MDAVDHSTAPPAPPDHPDAPLLQILAQFDAIEREYKALFPGQSNAIEDDDRRNARIAPLAARQAALIPTICSYRAQTAEGIVARAASLARWDTDLTPEGPMLAALLRDAAALAGRDRVPVSPDADLVALANTIMAERMATSYPCRTADESEMIHVCARLVAIRHELAVLTDADDYAADKGPLHARYTELHSESRDLRDQLRVLGIPRTDDGRGALAKVAIGECERTYEDVVVAQNLDDWFALAVVQSVAGTALQMVLAEEHHAEREEV